MAKVKGAKELRQAIRRAPRALQDEALVEVRKSARAMHRDAMARLNVAAMYAPLYHGQRGMQNITGIARRSYRYSVLRSQLKGRVGLLSNTSASRAFYLRYFNDGTSHQPARPFHDDAFDAEEDQYVANQTKALQSVLTKIFGPA